MKNYTEKTKTFLKDLWSLHSFKVVIVMLAIFIVITPLFFKKSMWDDIFSGIFAGLIIVFFQVFIDFEKLRLSKIIKRSHLKDMLEKRNNRRFYEEFLAVATENVDIMGTSAARFFQDFGSVTENRLIDELLHKGVRFRFLLTENSGENFNRVKPYIDKYIKNYNLRIHHFDQKQYIPQSIFIVDNECMLGPMFSGKLSKDTAALYFSDKNSGYAKQYVDYFEKIWHEQELATSSVVK